MTTCCLQIQLYTSLSLVTNYFRVTQNLAYLLSLQAYLLSIQAYCRQKSGVGGVVGVLGVLMVSGGIK